MRTFVTRLFGPRLVLALITAIAVGTAAAAHAALIAYKADLNGANESPANASPGIGTGEVDVDPVGHIMRVVMNFSGLTGNTTASHIHGATAVAGVGTAGVATVTPTFTGFPSGVTAATYDHTYDMTLASSYNASYITAHGGTTAQAEADLFQAIADGKAYLNIHSSTFGGGEIRGFLTAFDPTPTVARTWGRIKALYR